MTQQNEKPVKSFRAGLLEASVWRQEVVQDGQTVIRHSVRIQKQFRNKEGDYQDTDYFFRDELPRLAMLANKAYEYIALQESQDAEVETPV